MRVPVSCIYRALRRSEPCECLSEESGKAAYGIGKGDSESRIKVCGWKSSSAFVAPPVDQESRMGIVDAIQYVTTFVWTSWMWKNQYSKLSCKQVRTSACNSTFGHSYFIIVPAFLLRTKKDTDYPFYNQCHSVLILSLINNE